MNQTEIKPNHVVNIEHDTFLKLKEYCNRHGYKMTKWLTIKINEFIEQETKNGK